MGLIRIIGLIIIRLTSPISPITIGLISPIKLITIRLTSPISPITSIKKVKPKASLFSFFHDSRYSFGQEQ